MSWIEVMPLLLVELLESVVRNGAAANARECDCKTSQSSELRILPLSREPYCAGCAPTSAIVWRKAYPFQARPSIGWCGRGRRAA